MGLSSRLVHTFCREQIAWGSIRMGSHIPDIMQQVMQDALIGDRHAVHLALAMFGLLKR
jgi:hypothetical protein